MPEYYRDEVSAKTELRKVPLARLHSVISILEKDGWKTLMLKIPKYLDSSGSEKELKYTAEHVRLIEQYALKTDRKCTEILFDEWGTSGRVRPTLQTLKQLLVETLQFRAADVLAELLNEAKPRRPDEGPAADIQFDIAKILEDESLESHLNQMETVSVMPETHDAYHNNLFINFPHLPFNGNVSNVLNDLHGDSKSDNNEVPQPETLEVKDNDSLSNDGISSLLNEINKSNNNLVPLPKTVEGIDNVRTANSTTNNNSVDISSNGGITPVWNEIHPNYVAPLPVTVEAMNDARLVNSISNIQENPSHLVTDSATNISSSSLNVPDLTGLLQNASNEKSGSHDHLSRAEINDDTSDESELSDSSTEISSSYHTRL